MKKVVGVRVIVEGFHAFKNATIVFGPQVDFLSVRHRHNFGIVIEVEINHNDRDKEFILLQREVRQFIDSLYGIPAEFGDMSCESIAEKLMFRFNATMVQVDEDGENYAKITR